MLNLLALFEARFGFLVAPRPHEVFDLCALGLRIVKAAGLMQAFSLLNFPRQ